MRNDLIDYGVRGMLDYGQPPTVEDVLRGYADTRDSEWALKELIDWHQHGKEATGFKVGDRVRVRRRCVSLGDVDRKSGWSGYAPLFSDYVATVSRIFWNSTHKYWAVLITYDTDMEWSDWKKDFYVSDKTVSFYFAAKSIKKVHHPRRTDKK